MSLKITFLFVTGIVATSLLSAGCGGSSPAPEAPGAAPEAPPADVPAEPAPASARAGEHTMPDGTKMSGDAHKDHDHSK